jgi:hypothetical protein
MDIVELAIHVLRETAPSLATLVAAFFGAWFAYRLQENAKEKAQRASNINASNRALFSVFQQVNSLYLFKRDIIDPHRGNPGIVVAMQPVLPQDHDDLEFDFPSLGFLLNTKHKQIVLDLFIEQQRFQEAIKVINYRSALHLEQAQPILAMAGLKDGKEYSGADFANALGPRLFKELERATGQVVRQVDLTVESLSAVKQKMLKAFKELFPEGDFLNFELIEEKIK